MNREILKNENKGITLVALSITIIVLLILAGITFNTGKETIQKAKLEELKTNMLLIEAKAKEYVENANFKLGIKKDKTGEAKAELKGTELTNAPTYIEVESSEYVFYYELTTANLEEMGISAVESDADNGVYVVEYDIENAKVEVYHSEGFEGKHSLTDLENLSI